MAPRPEASDVPQTENARPANAEYAITDEQVDALYAAEEEAAALDDTPDNRLILECLAAAGYVLVKKGAVPPWMERHGAWFKTEHIEAWTVSEDHDNWPDVTPMFRLHNERAADV